MGVVVVVMIGVVMVVMGVVLVVMVIEVGMRFLVSKHVVLMSEMKCQNRGSRDHSYIILAIAGRHESSCCQQASGETPFVWSLL